MLLSEVCLSDVCLSVACIGPKSRTERPRKTKIGTEVAHVTRDSDITFRGQRSRSPGRFAHRRAGASGGCSGGRENVLAVGNCCYVAVCSAAEGASAPTEGGGGGAYRGGRPPTTCFINVKLWTVAVVVKSSSHVCEAARSDSMLRSVHINSAADVDFVASKSLWGASASRLHCEL